MAKDKQNVEEPRRPVPGWTPRRPPTKEEVEAVDRAQQRAKDERRQAMERERR